MISEKELSKLYEQYGFKKGQSNDDYLVFFSENGYFHNAEIVLLNPDYDKCAVSKEEYENLGYSARIIKYDSIEQAHEALFSGFFNTKISNNKLKREYNSFCKQQSEKLLGFSYEYIDTSYLENGIPQNDKLIEKIKSIFSSDDRQLMILEASAGYGKTCTSFEVINNLVDEIPTKIPLIAELSKNRTASVFRYVLLSEIDQKFPSLSSELVTYEIYEGRILLIIDGFDELLSKSNSPSKEKQNGSNKNAQTMLDTIAKLFPAGSKTKILLTTRKSSIFVGEEFDSWVEDHLRECNITRFQLLPPAIKDWLGSRKIEILKEKNIDLKNILNPVLLTLLRNEDEKNFSEKYTDNDSVVNQYFTLLLERERTRQALLLETEEQLDIMSKLAAEMVKYDFSAENIDLIRDFLYEIIEPDLNVFLERYRYQSDVEQKKTTAKDELLSKLIHHALLDRVSMQTSLIGFINDFIFGFMIARALIHNDLPVSELQGKYFEYAVTAYSTRSYEKRNKLYRIILPAFEKATVQQKINASINLINSIDRTYEGEYIDSVVFARDLKIISADSFVNCTFNECSFEHCLINTDAFRNCQFYNCTFYENNIESGEIMNCELAFLSCSGHEDFASKSYREVNNNDETQENFERIVLEQFWKPGYERAEPYRKFQVLLKGVASSKAQKIDEAVDSLIKKGIISKRLHVYELNFEKIDEIKEILGR